jgi:hypothetical protein
MVVAAISTVMVTVPPPRPARRPVCETVPSDRPGPEPFAGQSLERHHQWQIRAMVGLAANPHWISTDPESTIDWIDI